MPKPIGQIQAPKKVQALHIRRELGIENYADLKNNGYRAIGRWGKALPCP